MNDIHPGSLESCPDDKKSWMNERSSLRKSFIDRNLKQEETKKIGETNDLPHQKPHRPISEPDNKARAAR